MISAADDSLPESLYAAEAVREIDRYVIDKGLVPGFELMQRAAAGAFRRLVRAWPQPGPLLVLCGAGNNGGDGYLVAASAVRHGLDVVCVALSPPEKLKGDARSAWQKAVDDGVEVRQWHTMSVEQVDELFTGAGSVVDAMLGTGASGAPRAPFADAIRRCNESGVPVLAIDLPSGLDATTGAAVGVVVRAAMTVTFIGLKAGLFTGQGPEYAGTVVFESLEIGQWLPTAGQSPVARRADWGAVCPQLPQRPKTAHKGRFGHLLIVAGDRGFGGAGLMAAEAAVRSGAGLVTLATRPEHVAPALARCPSVMVQGIIHGSELVPLIENATTLVCGPGLGQSAWGQQMLQQVLASGKPQVLDADALNLLAQRAPVLADHHVLTPHSGEAARLLNVTIAEVEADRLGAARRLQETFGGVALLKGAGTVIAGAGLPMVVDGGNPGMACGGMGDVLSGIIGALLAQTGRPQQAAELGACLHLAAANVASRTMGYMALSPMDVIMALPGVLSTAEAMMPGYLPGLEDGIDG